MVSQSHSSVGATLCLAAAILISASTAHTTHDASFVPKRHRSAHNKATPGGFGRRQQTHQQEQQQQQQQLLPNKRRNLRTKNDDSRKLNDGLSNSLSMPASITYVDDFPPPILEATFSNDMSIPLVGADFDLSLPSIESEAVQPETVSLDNGDDGSSTTILASFVAGVSALVVAAAALFVKMRSVRNKELDAESANDEEDEQV